MIDGYDLAWSGLRPNIRSSIRPLADDESGKFESIEHLFNKAARAEIKEPVPAPITAPPPAPTQTTGQRKRRFDESVKEEPKPNLPPAPWLPRKDYYKRVKEGKCGRCGSGDHRSYDCPKFSFAIKPPDLGEEPPVKREKVVKDEK